MNLTTLHRAQVAGRARLGVACVRPSAVRGSWRSARVAPAFHGCRTSGLAAFATYGYAPNATIPAGDSAFMAMTTNTKRPARHLGTRTT